MIRSLLTRAASAVDTAFVSASSRSARGRREHHDGRERRPDALSHEPRVRALEHIRSIYDRPEHFADPSSLFPPPPAPSPRLTRVRALPSGEVLDATWPSDFHPFCADVAEKYLSYEKNRSAAARLFVHRDRPRPAVILIHGYRAGQFALEERVWPIDWLYERGLDVALTVLPLHAVRSAHRGAPRFPSSDPRITNEGFRQAVLDIQALERLLVDRGAPAVGIMGMSLGGYTAALLATIDERFAFVVPMIPLASLADVAMESDRFVGDADQKRLQHAALEAAHRPLSPFGRPPRVAPDRALVIGAAGDRITPIHHAERLAAHFSAPLEVMHGGHLIQLGRSEAFRAVGRMLGRLGVFTARRG